MTFSLCTGAHNSKLHLHEVVSNNLERCMLNTSDFVKYAGDCSLSLDCDRTDFNLYKSSLII